MPTLEPLEIKAILNALNSYIVDLDSDPELYAQWIATAKSALLKMKELDDQQKPVV